MGRYSGGLVQGTYGTCGNFELVTPAPNGEGLVHYSRDNDHPPYRWGGPSGFGTNRVDGVAMIQSDFGLFERNLEVIACELGALVHYWRDDPSFIWYRRRTPIATGVRGTPGFIQNAREKHGNFEVVVPLAAGGLARWWRNNHHPDLVWEGPELFGEGLFDAVALTQSNFGLARERFGPEMGFVEPTGNLEVVARQGDRLLFFWRDVKTARWHGPKLIPIEGAVTGAPVLIQSTYGARGDFQMIVPLAKGGLAHWERDNNHDDLPWREMHHFPGGDMSVVGLVQGTFGRQGNLELVVRENDRLAHYWRSSDYFIWQGPDPVAIEHTRAESEGPYRWNAAYLQEGTHITVPIELVPLDGVGEKELAEARERWRGGILDAWNCDCRCRTAHGAHKPLTFDVQWVRPESRAPRRPYDRVKGAPGHHRVFVARKRGRATMRDWGLNTSGAVAAHEFGHMLGLADEYEDPHCPNRTPVKTGSIMDRLGGKVLEHHVEHLCAPMCSQAATPAPPAERAPMAATR
jgi:hypothetical protein